MADETVINGEFSDDRTVEIAGDEALSKISALNQKISDLERENETIFWENKEYKQRVEELKASVEELSSENVELKKQVEKAESENKAMGAVAARAADLETEVSRLQHDLISAMSDLQESSGELSDLKKELEGSESREKEKDLKLKAIDTEKGSLVAEVHILRNELQGKETEVQVLKRNVEELEAMLGSSTSMEKLKDELEMKIEQMKVEINVLESTLDEKEKVISGYENKERAVPGGVNGGKKGLIGGSERDWLVLGASTVAAIAVIGVTCYVHASRKH